MLDRDQIAGLAKEDYEKTRRGSPGFTDEHFEKATDDVLVKLGEASVPDQLRTLNEIDGQRRSRLSGSMDHESLGAFWVTFSIIKVVRDILEDRPRDEE